MRYRVLVVDDNAGWARTVQTILRSLGDECDRVANQSEARHVLSQPDCEKYHFVLLDMEIPVDAEDLLPHVQNGKNLLAEIRRNPWMRKAPVIVMTSHGLDSYKLAMDVVELGAATFVGKEDFRERIDGAIQLALRKQAGVAADPPTELKRNAAELTPFQGGDLFLYAGHIELCRVEIPVVGQLHEALQHLKLRTASGAYCCYSGSELAKAAGVDGANALSGLLLRLRNRISELLEEQARIKCDKQDVIRSGGIGYRFCDWITVREGGDTAVPQRPAADVPEESLSLNPRQQWILDQLARGGEMSPKAIADRFDCSLPTAKRDLALLRDSGLIAHSGPNRGGCYILVG